MSGHKPKPSGQPLGAPPTGGSGVSNPERDLTIRIEALRSVTTMAAADINPNPEGFAYWLRFVESYLRKGLSDGAA